jgi:glucosamine-6-phosphate deaminase
MRIIVVPDKAAMGQRAADVVQREMEKHANPVIGLATGSTPLPLYQELVRRCREADLDFSTSITFNLDEYLGIPPEHEQSYRYFMNTNLFDGLNINKKNTHVPPSLAEDIGMLDDLDDDALEEVEEACDMYAQMIDDCGGIDLQVLGIGGNGHIGFNEPGSSFMSRTRVKTLSQKTREDNGDGRFFNSPDEVPKYAVTMGIGTILSARRCILMATGEHKAQALHEAIEGPMTAMCPASVLQMHQYATVIATEDAASKLTLPLER